MRTLNKKWKDYKAELKAKHFDRAKPKEEISKNVLPGVVKQQWLSLVDFYTLMLPRKIQLAEYLDLLRFTVMKFIRQKMPDCNLGGSRQKFFFLLHDPESSGTCYTSASSNPSSDT
uniref:Uncharacterized protein n=1 Tax=Ananas comosus var. bracteatus TaxID=296719 RepID=A0A6V7PEI4_ANACO|nr:unnamed protein product [Ananas comosus var. bracteatus]